MWHPPTLDQQDREFLLRASCSCLWYLEFRLLLSPSLLQGWRFEPHKYCRLSSFFEPLCLIKSSRFKSSNSTLWELYRIYNVALLSFLENQDWFSWTSDSVISCIESKECILPILPHFAHEIAQCSPILMNFHNRLIHNSLGRWKTYLRIIIKL